VYSPENFDCSVIEGVGNSLANVEWNRTEENKLLGKRPDKYDNGDEKLRN